MKQRTTNQPIEKSTNQLTQCQAISVNPRFSTSFQQIQAFQQAFSNLDNFSTLFPCSSQVFGKFSTMLFHSFIVKSNIFSNNSSILIASYIQVFISFQAQLCFHNQIQCLLKQFQHSGCKYYSSLLTFNTVLFHSFIRKFNTFL